jgi:hypothetical protein
VTGCFAWLQLWCAIFDHAWFLFRFPQILFRVHEVVGDNCRGGGGTSAVRFLIFPVNFSPLVPRFSDLGVLL